MPLGKLSLEYKNSKLNLLYLFVTRQSDTINMKQYYQKKFIKLLFQREVRMDTTKIHVFLNSLEKTRRRLNSSELELLYHLSFHPDPFIRSSVAALLVDHYEEKSELILLRLATDKQEIVRSDAAGALCIARSPKAIQQLLELAEHDPSHLVRGFAVHSIYYVFVNVYGDSEKTLITVRNIMRHLLDTETSQWVRICCCSVLCLSGDSEFLPLLCGALDNDDLHVRTIVIETFEEILNEENEAEIEYALKKHVSFEDDEVLADKIEDLLLTICDNREEPLI